VKYRLATLVGAVVAVVIAPLTQVSASTFHKPPAVSRATRAALLEAVCGPYNVNDDGGCFECPTFTGGDEQLEITVSNIHTGAFVNPGSTEAYLSLNGCEGKPADFGGGVLLRKSKSGWKVVRYDAGQAPGNCARFRYETGTVLLVCDGSYFGQGWVTETIGAQYVGPTSTARRPMLYVSANEETCKAKVHAFNLESWEPATIKSGAATELRVVVTENHSVQNPDNCEITSTGKVVTHRLTFRFDGKRFAPNKASAATVACMEGFFLATRADNNYCPRVG
jgi:hypothetical protein